MDLDRMEQSAAESCYNGSVRLLGQLRRGQRQPMRLHAQRPQEHEREPEQWLLKRRRRNAAKSSATEAEAEAAT